MQKRINLGNEKTAITLLEKIRVNKSDEKIRITNSHITSLNEIIGRKVFKKDSLYVNSMTLWEIMQPLGGRGKHHYHNLSPRNIFNALRSIKEPKDVIVSYDERFIIVTLATINDGANIVVIVSPNVELDLSSNNKVTKIITIYPMKIKK